MTTILCGGLGPWFCSLIFNASQRSKKQTHLIAHTLPHLAVDILNKPASDDKKRSREEEEECWVMILKIGPFEQWQNAMAFLNLWTSKTRGKMRRLERGFELFNDYKDSYGLKLWAQQVDRETSLRNFYHPVGGSGGTTSNAPILIKDEFEQDEEPENQMTLEELKSIFSVQRLDSVRVKTIKETHQKLNKRIKPLTFSSYSSSCYPEARLALALGHAPLQYRLGTAA